MRELAVQEIARISTGFGHSWNLTLDDTERAAVVCLADECDGWEVAYEPAP